MSIGIFLDKDHRPTAEEVLDELGPIHPLWVRLTAFIADNYQMPGELSFGGKKYGWNFWYRKSSKSLVSLYPQHEYFVAQIVLGRLQAEEAQQLEWGENVRRVLSEAPQLHDGRWLFIQVRSEADVKDVERLLQIKRRFPRQKAR